MKAITILERMLHIIYSYILLVLIGNTNVRRKFSIEFSFLENWRKMIEDYLERGIILVDSTEAKNLIQEATIYTMVDD